MSFFDDDVPKKPAGGAITVGEDLSNQSEQELSERIEALTEEVNRTRKELEQRSTIRNTADAFFQKKPVICYIFNRNLRELVLNKVNATGKN